MRTAKLASDPLWQCLCPQWSRPASTGGLRSIARNKTRVLRHPHQSSLATLQQRRNIVAQAQERDGEADGTNGKLRLNYVNHAVSKRGEAVHNREHALRLHRKNRFDAQDAAKETTPYLYTRLRTLAIGGRVKECRELAEYLVKERQEKPNVQLYSALILSNISHDQGSAWRVADYLEEMRQVGLSPDVGCCHAVLKVLSVHPDHLLRADVLECMRAKWYTLSEEGAHDVAAGLFREGLFEQALLRLDLMQREGMQVQGWLLDMAVYMLCAAGEVEEAYRIMHQRYNGGEFSLSRTVWHTLLDAGSSYRHHPSTSLIWNSQVNPGYLNPSSGICFNALVTASQAGDAALATDVFTHLSKRGTAFQPIHYQLLSECYLNSSPPDFKRALSILTIMALEKVEPTLAETRALYTHLRASPTLVSEAFAILRELHDEGRKIPIAALNLLIECYVEQRNLPEALKIYKLIHTFLPLEEASKKTFANIETFNLLLRGCRLATPPDEGLASFLVSELLALHVKPTALTYDRLILVFVEAGAHALAAAISAPDPLEAQSQRAQGKELLDWAFRHFTDMRAVSRATAAEDADPSEALGWMPRFGTVERLATQLATVGDRRCWDVLQSGEDSGEDGLEGWAAKGKWVKKNVEEAWEKAMKDRGGRELG